MRVIDRASKRNFARQNKIALGPRGQTETSLKIKDLRPMYRLNPPLIDPGN